MRNKHTGMSMAFTDAKTERFEAAIAHAADACIDAPFHVDALLEVWIVAVFARPKRLMRRKDPEGRILHGSPPDADNIAKAVIDALNPWITMDQRVARLHVGKVYAAIGEPAHVEVEIEELAT